MKPDHSRRKFLARAGALVASAWCGNAFAQAADPELLKFVESLIGIDIHSHAGGVHFRTKGWSFNLADRMKEGRIAAVCYGHTGDGPALGRDGENRLVSRSVAPGLLWQHTLQRLELIAATGGVVGVWTMAYSANTLAEYVERVARMVEAIVGGNYLRVFNATC